jgi:serine/threonine-protein kinase
LAEAHAAGLIHRDVKPGNIIAAQRGGQQDVVKLVDFGLVKPRGAREDIAITQHGSLAGSPLYMSPEQALGKGTPDARSDIYSLGSVGYFLLTGRPPFEGEEPMEVLVAHARDTVRPLRELCPDVPADLEQVILRALEKDPDARFQSAVEMEQALADCRCAGAWTAQDAAAWWRQLGESRELALSEPA